MTETPTVTVARRFRGPAHSGNGGYTAGVLAQRLLDRTSDVRTRSDRAVRVRLHVPPPLDRALEVDVDGRSGTATLRDGSTTVATAVAAEFDLAAVPSVPAETAAAAGPYPGQTDHPFPGCFVCGTDRARLDGLRIFPGRIGDGRTACTWTPDSSNAVHPISGDTEVVPPEIVWAALDCPGGWCSDLGGRPMVLGTMTAAIIRLPRVGEHCVITGRLDTADERRSSTSTALYGSAGDLVARAEAIWVRVDPEVFNRLEARSG